MQDLARRYGITQTPLIALGPMRLIATAPLTAAVSNGGGLGFLGAGSDMSMLLDMLKELDGLLQNKSTKGKFGIGILCWGADLNALIKAMETAPTLPCAVWLYASHQIKDLQNWSEAIRKVSKGSTDIWIQIGSVAEAREACKYVNPDVLICQGVDAGGHGLTHGCSFVSLLPEVSDMITDGLASGDLIARPYLLAAGGISEGRGAAAAIACGADGIVMGTRFLASEEAKITEGYRQEVVRANDGGQTTVRSKVYDTLRGTTDWPERYGGRGVINASYEDWRSGMSDDENKKLYEKSQEYDGNAGWGPNGRMTTYAGTSIGLVKSVQPAAKIVLEVAESCQKILRELNTRI